MLIELNDAVFGYEKRPVVRVDALALYAGRCLGIFGPNGAGKSTLVRGLTGLLPPLAGSVKYAQQRARIGYMPQHRHFEAHWPMSALDAASMAVSSRKRLGWIGRDAEKVLDAMRRLAVDDLADRPFARLSGGQQQRILLAGALASEPGLLVLDEPTEGLDVRSRRALLEVLRAEKSGGLCTVLISHEVSDLVEAADEVAWLHPGDQATEPSVVEVIAPTALAGRVAAVRSAP